MEPDSRAPDGACRLRPLNEPVALEVSADAAGSPCAVRFRGRRRDVVDVQEVWRVDDEWWRPEPISRLYFRLVLDGGQILTVYLDLREESWWLQRY